MSEMWEIMSEVGKDARRHLKLKPAKVVVVEDWYYTYACRRCEKENIETPVVKAVKEPSFSPDSFAIPVVAARLAVQKFVIGSHLYRQEQELRQQGIHVSRQTMSNWLLWSAEHLLLRLRWLNRMLCSPCSQCSVFLQSIIIFRPLARIFLAAGFLG